MEDLSMRTLVILIAVMVTLFITSCSTTYYSTNPPAYDDVYYTTPVAPVATETVVITDYTDNPSYNGEELYGEGEFISDEEVYEFYEPSYQDSYSYTDPDGATYITNNYYGDYNDYSYTSRIRRFYDPCYSSYYCDYYTNPYAYDPYYYGSNWSLSIGFGWGWGSYGFSWGYPYYYNPYYSWGYPSYGWYDPWFGYPYYGYNSYWAGYWDGYYDGYYGYYPDGGYYPDYSSVYYGPRTSREGTNNPGSGNRGTTGDNLGNDQPAAGLLYFSGSCFKRSSKIR